MLRLPDLQTIGDLSHDNVRNDLDKQHAGVQPNRRALVTAISRPPFSAVSRNAFPKEITPEFVRSEVAAGPRHHPGQHQSSRMRADDHRAQLPREDQRQHRQQRRGLEHRGGGREDALGHQVGRGHRHGPLHRQEHPRHARMDHPQLARAHRHRADLPGARKGRRQGRGAHLGNLPRHAHRAGRAGGGLFHRPRRRAAALHPAHGEPHDRHRLARRQHHGQMVPRASPGKFPLHALGRDLRHHGRLRRALQHRRRPASRLDCRRQRRGAIRRTQGAGRTDRSAPGPRACR